MSCLTVLLSISEALRGSGMLAVLIQIAAVMVVLLSRAGRWRSDVVPRGPSIAYLMYVSHQMTSLTLLRSIR